MAFNFLLEICLNLHSFELLVSVDTAHHTHLYTVVSAHSAGAYTATLLVMVNVMRVGGRAPPTHTSQG
jgi:hypothetical protein